MSISIAALVLVAFWFVGAISAFADKNEDLKLARSLARAFSNTAKSVKPAVVFVKVEKEIDFPRGSNALPFDDFFRFGPFGWRGLPQTPTPRQAPRRGIKRGQGSGFIVSSDGYILTNRHVVDGSDKIKVLLTDGREFTAKKIGTDKATDVAVIKIDGKKLPTVKLGDSDKIEVGEWVIAIGNPFGLAESVTVGVVSAKGRAAFGVTEYGDFIQTDAAINPGNSGGPLVNLDGEVIGMNTAIFSRSGGNLGIGFAIPSNIAREVRNQLVKSGTVVRGWLGVVIQDINAAIAPKFNVKNGEGVLVAEVSADSPAEKAKIQVGDVIVDVDGEHVADVHKLKYLIAWKKPGSKVKVGLLRDGKRLDITVPLGTFPEGKLLAMKAVDTSSKLAEFGITVQELTPDLAGKVGHKGKRGLLITEVKPGSAADSGGISKGMLILEVNRTRVNTVEDLNKTLESQKPEEAKELLLLVSDGRFSRYVMLKLD